MVETNNLRIKESVKPLSPNEVKKTHPLSEESSLQVEAHRNEISNIVQGRDNRLMVVLGPCSIHSHESAIDYAKFLQPLQKQFDNLKLVMRVYFEKPRTTVGWKGLINDPNLDGSFNINQGLTLARKIMVEIADMNIPIANEQLDLMTPQYFSDITSWAAIGARTTESQGHREMASGLSYPVGFKNGTGGSTGIAIDGMYAASHEHHFMGIDGDGQSGFMTTTGNPDTQIVLRGGSQNGKTRGNYHLDDIERVAEEIQARDITPKIMVDASHKNAHGGFKGQLDVIRDICTQIMDQNSFLIQSIMLESHLVEGKQNINDIPLNPHQSATDGCIGKEDTLRVLEQLNEAAGYKIRNAG